MPDTRILSIDTPNAFSVAQEALGQDGLIVFPTDTLYGLACYPHAPQALSKLYEVKHRSNSKAIPVLIGSLSQLETIVKDIPESAKKLINAFWPGGLTLILPKQDHLPDLLSPFEGIAVRMPNHPFALELLQKLGPLAVTSANLSDHANHADIKEIESDLGEEIALIIDGGKLKSTTPSTIVDCLQSPPKVLRFGAISEEDILKVLNA